MFATRSMSLEDRCLGGGVGGEVARCSASASCGGGEGERWCYTWRWKIDKDRSADLLPLLPQQFFGCDAVLLLCSLK